MIRAATPGCDFARRAFCRLIESSLAGCALLLTIVLSGCDRPSGNNPAPTTAPTSAPVSQAAKATGPTLQPLAPGATTWTREQAAQHLADEKLAVSAAFRLIQLAELVPSWAPRPLTVEAVERVRVRRLDEMRWVVGLDAGRFIREPLLLLADGSALELVNREEAEATEILISPNEDSSPHLIVTPTRVLTLPQNTPQAALRLQTQGPAQFKLIDQGAYPQIALRVMDAAASQPIDADAVVVATYRWDPLEGVFMGPASDKLPDPPGGRFAIDMDESPLLMPVGGDVGEAPEPVAEANPQQPVERPQPW